MQHVDSKKDLALLLSISSFIIFWNLGLGSLESWDSALYAQVARELLHSRNWFDLTWMGSHYFSKPPLAMWVTAFFYKLFGVNEFSARLFSALCGTGTIIVTYLFTKKTYSRKVALSAAFILLSTLHFIWSSKIGMLDMPVTFFITLSFLLFNLGENRPAYLFTSMISLACAFLIKGGPVLIAFAIIGIYLFALKKRYLFKEPWLRLGIAAFLILVSVRPLYLISCYGHQFVDVYFFNNIVSRSAQPIEGHAGELFEYVKILTNKGRPWGIFSLIALPWVLWRIFIKKEQAHSFVVIWFIVFFTSISLVQTKLHWYIIPLYPAASMLVAWSFNKVLRRLSILMVPMLCLAALIYLITFKGILNLDYTPETKKIALTLKTALQKGERVFLYEVGDPALRFYLGDVGELMSAKSIVLNQRKINGYLVFERKTFEALEQKPAIIMQDASFIITKACE